MNKLRAQFQLVLWKSRRAQLEQEAEHIGNVLSDDRMHISERNRNLADYNSKNKEIQKLDRQIARAESHLGHGDNIDPDCYVVDDDQTYTRTAFTPIGNAINRKLGPLPPNINTSTPVDELIGVRICTPLLIIAYIGTLFAICVGPFVTPWLFYGGAHWLMGGATINLSTFGPLQVMAIAYVALTFLCPAKLRQFICHSSTHHTNRYRAGAEAWTWKQRVSSNVLSSFDSILLFVLFPFASLVIISGVSTLFMQAYLLERQVAKGVEQASEHARLAMIKLHNEYTEGVFLTLAIITLMPWLFQAIGQ